MSAESLRADLESAGFSAAGLTAALGDVAASALDRGNPVPASLVLGDAPLDVLIRLFVLGEPIADDALGRALPRCGVAGAVALGLVSTGAGLAAPTARIRPWAVADEAGVQSGLLVSDPHPPGTALRADHVLGLGAAATTMRAVTVPKPGGSVLDLGAGSGIQSLWAARWAGRIVATDLSERASAYARLNAALHGIELDVRQGSLYAPVAGERFDAIVCNPPFVITPRDGAAALEHRDAGLVGDAFVEGVVRGAADHLNPGGVASVLANWEVRDGDDVAARERVLGWAADVGLDAWLVQRDVVDPARYAEVWIEDAGVAPASSAGTVLQRAWIGDFVARGVTDLGIGFIVLRLPDGVRTLARHEEVDRPDPTGFGAAIAAGLATHDWQAGRSDAELERAFLLVDGAVTEERTYLPGAADPMRIRLRLGTGFGRERAVDSPLAAVVGACDGELSLGAIVAAVLDLLDLPASARPTLLAAVRELLVEGFLRPAGAVSG